MLSTQNQVKELVGYITAQPPCDKLNVENYLSMVKYKHAFLNHMIKSQGLCSRGEMVIHIAKRDNKYTWSLLDDTKYKTCDDRNSIAYLQISIGPYTTRDIKTIAKEYTELRSKSEISPHSNILFFNTTTKEITRIEPYGFLEGDKEHMINDALEEYFKNTEYHYTPTFPMCGAQMKTDDRYCRNWSSLILYFMLKYPGTSYYSIQEYLGNQSKKELNDLVDKWHCFTVNYVEKNGIKDAYERMRYMKRYPEVYDRVKRSSTLAISGW